VRVAPRVDARRVRLAGPVPDDEVCSAMASPSARKVDGLLVPPQRQYIAQREQFCQKDAQRVRVTTRGIRLLSMLCSGRRLRRSESPGNTATATTAALEMRVHAATGTTAGCTTGSSADFNPCRARSCAGFAFRLT
jgi:hypothetical protein